MIINAQIVVVVATKDRPQALEKFALASLNKSSCNDFVCLVWDASTDTKSQQVCDANDWNFPLVYMKAPRAGLTSQRNDAIEYILKNWAEAMCCVFIDDDSDLSPDALGGVIESFSDQSIGGISIPIKLNSEQIVEQERQNKRSLTWLRKGVLFIFGLVKYSNRRLISFGMMNLMTEEDENNVSIEWCSGCGMCFRTVIFQSDLRFNEELQQFGGYSLGEDLYMSISVAQKKWRLKSALKGFLVHHCASGGRLSNEQRISAEFYNRRLLFDHYYQEKPFLVTKLMYLAYLWSRLGLFLMLLRKCSFVFLAKGILKAVYAYQKRGAEHL